EGDVYMSDVERKISEAVLLAEYAEIGENLRHYANLQFAQLSIYVAVAGAIIAAVISESARDLFLFRWVICGAGALLGIPFLLMSLRVSRYWDKHVKRAREIEEQLGMSSYRRPLASGVQNRFAVMLFYLLVIASFITIAHVVPS